MLQAGKHPGKINLTDVDNGINILQYLHARPAAVILKHNNPCGAAWTEQGLETALKKAFWSDRIAAFGGTVVVNRTVDAACAAFSGNPTSRSWRPRTTNPEALDILKKRKNLRILRIPGLGRLENYADKPFLDIKSLADGGMIVQFSFSQPHPLASKTFLPAKAKRTISWSRPEHRMPGRWTTCSLPGPWRPE
jgi:phosphoribosylaminoimidazolecarboxamide formyltransferase / IMP cyclohydrolase